MPCTNIRFAWTARFLLSCSSLLFATELVGAQQQMQNPHGANPHANSHDAMGNSRPTDSSQADPTIAARTIVVSVVDPQGQPVQNASVELSSLFQSIGEGNSDKKTVKTTGADGLVTFTDLDQTLRYSYQVRVDQAGANYELPAFRLGQVGQRLLFHVYPTTSDLRQAFVGFRGLTYIQMREDSFHVSAMYRVLNMSQQTYLPKDITIRLPAGAKAVDVETKVGDAGFVQEGNNVKLVGSFPPGNRDLQFSFQLENQNKSELHFEMGTPPHLAEQRVLVEETPGMELSVAGFQPSESTFGPEEKKVIFAQKVMQVGQGELSNLSVELSGLPTIGPGRWIALGFAALLAFGGATLALFRSRKQSREEIEQEQIAARKVLLSEIQLLEIALRTEKIGPRTYEQTKREIMLALARLESLSAA